MEQQTAGWGQARSTVLGVQIALISGVLAIVFAFVITGEQTLFNLIMSVAGVLAIITFAAGLFLLRGGAGPRASRGFLGIIVSVLALLAAYTGVDPIQTSGSIWQGLDFLLVLVGDVAALIGGVLLGTSLGALSGGSGLGKASGYAFLVGGVFQMGAGVPDLGSIMTESTSLGDMGHILDGLAGIVFVIIGPALLYVAVRRLRAASSRKDSAA